MPGGIATEEADQLIEHRGVGGHRHLRTEQLWHAHGIVDAEAELVLLELGRGPHRLGGGPNQ